MSVGYTAVGWNRQKRLYDAVLLTGVALYLASFLLVGLATNPELTAESLVIRACGTGAFGLLHVVLAIGPLARLDARFLPLLYNRRHLGVTMFLLALVHGVFALVQFHALGNVHPLESLFTANSRYDSFVNFPFQPLGFGALVILFCMAATSHDFWLKNLGAPVWKALHMGVYLAYALLVGHVVLGSLQAERSPLLAGLVGLGLALVLALHLLAGWRERALDRERRGLASDGFVDVGGLDEIEEGRAKVVSLGGERVAIFRHAGRLSALSNACRHQNGPLGEGRILDGCITCPWHGYQYRPEDGCSPPPFTEKVATFELRLARERIFANPRALPPGTPVEPARIAPELDLPPSPSTAKGEFYIGYLPHSPPRLAARTRAVALLGLALAGGLGAAASASFERQPLARFEYGHTRSLRGTLSEFPYPALLVARPGTEAGESSESRYHLVALGKHGASEAVRGKDGQRVECAGTLIFRDGQTMLELLPGSLRAVAVEAGAAGEAPAPLPAVSLGEQRLAGEIVDSKCFLGVMKPGNLKPHRACAARCISGGIPPVLCVRDESGAAVYLLLVDRDGSAVNARVLDFVAEPIEISGEVLRLGEQLVLRADPATYKRL